MTHFKKARLALWILIAVLLAGLAFAYYSQKNPDRQYADEINQEDKTIKPEFNLVDMNGVKVTAQSWPGKYRVVFFGYANCPDMCPTGMHELSVAMDRLSAAAQDKIQPLFITIDPVRDTPAELKVFIAQFHSKIIGLSGPQDEINKVTEQFKVYAARVPEPDGVTPDADEYLVDHSQVFYILDPQNNFVKALPADNIKTDDLVKELAGLIK